MFPKCLQNNILYIQYKYDIYLTETLLLYIYIYIYLILRDYFHFTIIYLNNNTYKCTPHPSYLFVFNFQLNIFILI